MKRMLSLILALSLLALCGCGGKADETTVPTTTAPVETTAEPTTEAPTETTEAPTETTEAVPVNVNPLTGETLEEDNTMRPIAVMINNSSKALPQCGIGEADVIYEILAEGSTTRFMAIFTDVTDAGAVGPVRSLRPYFLNIMRGYDALCTSAGGSDEADDMISSLGYDRMNGINGSSANYFYRDSWRKENRGFEHSLFVKGEDLYNGAQKLGMRVNETEGWDYGLTFDDGAVLDGDAAGKIVVKFYANGKSTTLTYQADGGYYTAYQQGYDLVDGNTNEALKFENVFVLLADSAVKDSKGHLEVQTTGEGTGYYARDGKVIQIKWTRADEESAYQYFDLEGNRLTLGVGKSYIAIVPENDYKLDIT